MSHSPTQFQSSFYCLCEGEEAEFSDSLRFDYTSTSQNLFPILGKTLANVFKDWVVPSSSTLSSIVTQSHPVAEILYLTNTEIGKKGFWGLFLP